MKTKKKNQQKRKVKKVAKVKPKAKKVSKAKSKTKSKKNIFLNEYSFENNISKKKAIDKFGDLEHGKMSYKTEKIEKRNFFDFIFKKPIEQLIK